MGFFGSLLTTGAQMANAAVQGRQEGQDRAARMRKAMVEEALLGLRQAREETDRRLSERKLSNYLTPQQEAALRTDENVRQHNAEHDYDVAHPAPLTPQRPVSEEIARKRALIAAGVERDPNAPPREAAPPQMTPAATQNYYQDLVDDVVNAAGGDVHDAWNKAIRLDSRLRPLIQSGKITHTDIQAGAERYTQRKQAGGALGALLNLGHVPTSGAPVKKDEAPRSTPTPRNEQPTPAPKTAAAETPQKPKAERMAELKAQGYSYEQAAALMRSEGYDVQ